MTVCICQISSNCTIKFMNYMYVNDTSIKLPKYHTAKLPGNQAVLGPGSLLGSILHFITSNFVLSSE